MRLDQLEGEIDVIGQTDSFKWFWDEVMVSLVWSVFTKEAGHAKCNICYKKVVNYGNTTNLKRHLHLNHPGQYNDIYKGTNIDNQPKIDDTINDIAAFTDGSHKFRSDMKLANWVVKSGLPFRTTDSSYLQSFLSSLNVHYKLPSRTKMTTMIQDLYIYKRQKLQTKLEEVKWVAFTADGWKDTSNQCSYLGVTLHYIENYRPISFNLSTDRFEGEATGSALVASINNIFLDWNISHEQIMCFVSDGAPNFVSAGRSFKTHIHCVAHRLNLAVVESLTGLKNINDIIDKVRTLVTTFKHSIPLMDKLMKERERKGLNLLKLKQDVPTRWNSIFIMLSRYLELKNEISMVLIEAGKRAIDLDPDEVDVCTQMNAVLKPLFQMTEDISGEKYVTISRVIPIITNGLSYLDSEPITDSDVALLKIELMTNLEKRFCNIEKQEIFAFATLLDPRFKQIDFRSPVNAKLAQDRLSSMLINVELSQKPQTEINEIGIWEIGEEKRKRFNRDNIIDSGLKHYLELPTIDRNTDPLEFWRKNKETWPQLHNLALKYLVTPATSVPCERIFSKAGQIINNKRNRIKPKNVSILCFLDSLPENYI